jgi:hypothetical protein
MAERGRRSIFTRHRVLAGGAWPGLRFSETPAEPSENINILLFDLRQKMKFVPGYTGVSEYLNPGHPLSVLRLKR